MTRRGPGAESVLAQGHVGRTLELKGGNHPGVLKKLSKSACLPAKSAMLRDPSTFGLIGSFL